MSVRDKWIPAFAFLVCALAMGVPYWLTPYNELNLPNALYGPGLGLLVATAALAVGWAYKPFWRSSVIIGSAAPAVVAARIALEASADPTTHNLWPFELVIAGALGTVCALAGSSIGWAVCRLRSRHGATPS